MTEIVWVWVSSTNASRNLWLEVGEETTNMIWYRSTGEVQQSSLFGVDLRSRLGCPQAATATERREFERHLFCSVSWLGFDLVKNT